jgi:hypothetical protein
MDQVLNPQTKRYVKKNSQQYNKLVREGVIQAIEEPAEETPPIKALLAEELTTIVKENKPLFQKELTQAQSDALLRKLLYEKLCISKKPKKEEKTKKKKKFKIVAPPSSSESESESSD